MLIAFVAPKQYGKTTACNILKEHWVDNVVQVNFKDALVAEIKQNFPDLLEAIKLQVHTEMCLVRNDWTIQPLTIDQLFQLKPSLIRTLMQNYGTEVRRGDEENYWVLQWGQKVHDLANRFPVQNVLTDDVRFINEAEYVKKCGGIIIRLNRTDKTSTDTHSSETEQKQIVCDYEIMCGEGEFEDLKRQLLQIVQQLA